MLQIASADLLKNSHHHARHGSKKYIVETNEIWIINRLQCTMTVNLFCSVTKTNNSEKQHNLDTSLQIMLYGATGYENSSVLYYSVFMSLCQHYYKNFGKAFSTRTAVSFCSGPQNGVLCPLWLLLSWTLKTLETPEPLISFSRACWVGSEWIEVVFALVPWVSSIRIILGVSITKNKGTSP